MPFQAILFDPASQTSTATSIRVFGSGLEIVDPAGGESRRVDSARCELRAAGWDHQSIEISWPEAKGTCAISTRDHTAPLELSRIPRFEAALAEAAATRRRAVRHGRIGIGVVVLATLLPALILLVLFAFRNQIVDAVLKRIPISLDQEVGRMFEGEILGSAETLPEGEATRAVGLIVDRLKTAMPVPGIEFRVRVRRNGQVNAFAAPGGLIVVNTGLIKEAESGGELAGVLAHEMAHAQRRHSMRQLIYGAGLVPLIGLLIGEPDAASLARNLGQLSELRFSRGQEEDADRAGFDALVAAGIDPRGMARFLDGLSQMEGTPPTFLSTHPSSAGRAAAIRERRAELSGLKERPLSIDWAAVQASIR